MNEEKEEFSLTKTTTVKVAGYEIQKKLGSGSFATVYRGKRCMSRSRRKWNGNEHAYENEYENENLPEVVAIKAISKRTLSKKVLSNLDLEIRILNQLKCANIVELYHVVKKVDEEEEEEEEERSSNTSKQRIYLIMEYCSGGDLQRLIRTRKAGRLSESLSRRLMRDLSYGLRFLWSRVSVLVIFSFDTFWFKYNFYILIYLNSN